MKQTYETGLSGEKAAETYLTQKKGMRCLERRYRCKCGEIDLIMLDQGCLVFVEVKTRKTGEPGEGLKAVNFRKQQRIVRASSLYMLSARKLNSAVRYDVVEVFGDSILHIPNAFQPQGRMFYR